MKKVININFQGRVVTIEEIAYENLKAYIQSLRTYFAKEADSEEIINDIEWRISELFDEIIQKGNACITQEHLDSIIKSIGRPAELQEEDDRYYADFSGEKKEEKSGNAKAAYTAQQSGKKRLIRDETNKKLAGVCAGIGNYFGIDHTIVRVATIVLSLFYFAGVIAYIVLWAALPATNTKSIGSPYKKLFRDPLHKTLGGVCSGLAHYFNTETWIIRLVFVLCVISPAIFGITHIFHARFGGSLASLSSILYIVLWIVIPKAKRPTDFLSMRGENIDINSIRSSRSNAPLDPNSPVANQNATVAAENKSTMVETQAEHTDSVPLAQRLPSQETKYAAAEYERSSGGSIIVTLFKVFAYIIIGCILLVVLSVLFGFGVAGFAAFPFLNFYFDGGWQNTVAMLGIIFGIWLPIIVCLVWIIRKMIGYNQKSPRLAAICLVLWLIGLASLITLVVNGYQKIQDESDLPKQTIAITDSLNNKLELDFETERANKFMIRNFRIFPFSSNRKFYLGNIYVDIEKSADSNYHLYQQNYANGSSEKDANKWANQIGLVIDQRDSLFAIRKGILIDANHKFRNQRVYLTVAVPVGKKILISRRYNKLVRGQIGGFYSKNNYKWKTGTEYMMTPDGLQALSNDTDLAAPIKKMIDEEIKVRKETLNGITKYYVEDKEVDSLQYEKMLLLLQILNTDKGADKND